MVTEDELLTVSEAAKLLKVTPHTIYRWIGQGRLPAVRYSRRVVRLRRSDVTSAPGKSSLGNTAVSGGAVHPVVREVAATPCEATKRDEGREKVDNLISSYRDRVNQPRPPGEPPKGSREALIRRVGVISKEEGEELRRLIMQDRETSRYDPD